MAFISEYVNEAKKARINLNKVPHPIHKHAMSPYQWAVDYERHIALMPMGVVGVPEILSNGIKETTYMFVLFWQGQLVNVFLYGSSWGDLSKNTLETSWRIDKILSAGNIPRRELLRALKEALYVFGLDAIRLRNKIKGIYFEF